MRQLLKASGKPWVMENVPTAPLNATLFLCSTMFPELRVIRHRIFEFGNIAPLPVGLWQPPRECNHWGTTSGNAAWAGRKRVQASFDNFDFLTVTGHDFKVEDGKIAMGIDWMVGNELREAIPPAYGEYVFTQLRTHLGLAPDSEGSAAMRRGE
jgi:DNA (cytosine-5)-methyltransferase 1